MDTTKPPGTLLTSYSPVILATQEVEAGGPQVPGQSALHNEILFNKNKKKLHSRAAGRSGCVGAARGACRACWELISLLSCPLALCSHQRKQPRPGPFESCLINCSCAQARGERVLFLIGCPGCQSRPSWSLIGLLKKKRLLFPFSG